LLYAASGFVECHRVATPLSRVIYKSRYVFIHMCIGCSNHISLLSFSQQTGNCALYCSLYMLITGSIGWQGTSNSSMQFVTNRNPEEHRPVLFLPSTTVEIFCRCKLADEMQPMLCMIRFIAEVEMILLPSTTTLLYTYVVCCAQFITIDIRSVDQHDALRSFPY
jgi:hypothetical protein